MSDRTTVTGIVATQPRHIVTGEGQAITSFRLASTQRLFDREAGRFVERGTNWYTITAFRTLAANAAESIGKGDRIIVAGRIRIRDWSTGEKSGTTVEVEAESIGHDLAWGTTRFQRAAVAAVEPSAEAQPVETDAAPAEADLLAAGIASGRVSIIPVGFAA